MVQQFQVVAILIGIISSPVQAVTYKIRATDCRAMVQQHDGSSVAYQPGIDVRGNAVMPADVGTEAGALAGIAIPEAVDIDIGIDLADRLGRRDSAGARALLPAEGHATLGVLTIKGGDAFWNGEKIAPRDQVALTESCRAALGADGQIRPLPKPPVPRN